MEISPDIKTDIKVIIENFELLVFDFVSDDPYEIYESIYKLYGDVLQIKKIIIDSSPPPKNFDFRKVIEQIINIFMKVSLQVYRGNMEYVHNMFPRIKNIKDFLEIKRK